MEIKELLAPSNKDQSSKERYSQSNALEEMRRCWELTRCRLKIRFEKNRCMEESHLPPLSPNNRNGITSEGDSRPSMQRTRRELIRMYGRLDTLTNEVAAIRSQLPNDLPLSLSQIGDTLNRLGKGTSDELQVPKDGGSDLISTARESLRTMVNDEITKTKFRMSNDTNDESYEEDKIGSERLDAVGVYLRNQIHLLEVKLTELQNKFQKLHKAQDEGRHCTELDALTIEADTNKSVLSDVQRTLYSLESQTVQVTPIVIQETKTESPLKKVVKSNGADLTIPFDELMCTVREMEDSYGATITDLEHKQKALVQRAATLNGTLTNIHQLTQSIESKATKAEVICRELVEKTTALSEKAQSAKEREIIKAISEMIAQRNQTIQTEIEQLKQRLKICSASTKQTQRDESTKEISFSSEGQEPL